ncbi:MAG: Panacea domain-containing protein [Polyangiaceae bacterium]|nr:Panacea domain-containing protein [Polyangiaceae bacterium]
MLDIELSRGIDELRSFDELRSVQACAVLLRKAGGASNYTRILKLLYLADRRSLQETGQPITGAHFVNMPLGPVLSEVYECIKEDSTGGLWDQYIVTKGRDIHLIKDPGDGELSDFDVDVLTDLAEQYAQASYSTMINVVHKLPEWTDPSPKKVAPLYMVDVLLALGDDEETIVAHAITSAHVDGVKKLFHLS